MNTHTSFAQIYNSLTQAIVICDQNLAVVSANHAAEQLFSQNAPALCKQAAHDLFAPDCAIFASISSYQNNHSPISARELPIASKYFGNIIAEINISGFRDADQDFIMLGLTPITVHDATIDADILANIWGFLSHEARTPLAAIQAAAQILRDGFDNNTQEHELCDVIESGATRIANLVAHMEIFSGTTNQPKCAQNIHEILAQSILTAKLTYAQSVDFVEIYDPSLPEIMMHEQHLAHIIDNLLRNAAEAAIGFAKLPQIHITTKYRIGYTTKIPGQVATPHLPILLSICDNGPGVVPELARDIFKPFVTTKPQNQGSAHGLGLALVAKLIDEMQGDIQMKRANDTTSVSIGLPLGK